MDEPRRDAPLADAPQPGAIPNDTPLAAPELERDRDPDEPGEARPAAADLDDAEQPPGGGAQGG